MSEVTRKEFEALEKVFSTLADTVKDLATKVNSAVVSSVEVAVPVVEPIDPPKPFTLKGVGKVQLKYPRVDFGGKKYKSAEIEKDAQVADALYNASPSLFILLKD
jgi:hypothetical protein